jgi:hypothetical protein
MEAVIQCLGLLEGWDERLESAALEPLLGLIQMQVPLVWTTS